MARPPRLSFPLVLFAFFFASVEAGSASPVALSKRAATCVPSLPEARFAADGSPCAATAIVECCAYPGATWDTHMQAGSSVQFLVANPDGGAPTSVDPGYAMYIRKVQAEGIRVLGLVVASPWHNLDSVKASIDLHLLEYGTDGIMIDQAWMTNDWVAFYTDLAAYIRGKGQCEHTYVWLRTIGGVPIVEPFVNIADTITMFYGTGIDYLSTTFPSWSTDGTYPATKFSYELHTADPDFLEEYIEKSQQDRAGYFYARGGSDDGVWAGFASMVSLLDFCPASTAGATGVATGELTGDAGSTGETAAVTTGAAVVTTGDAVVTTGDAVVTTAGATTAVPRQYSDLCVATRPVDPVVTDGKTCPLLFALESSYPGTIWDDHLAAAPAFIIVQPDGGNPTAIDAVYETYIHKAQDAGVRVLGLVTATFGSNSVETVKAAIDFYLRQYIVDGIVLAEVIGDNNPDYIAYYKEITDFIRAQSLCRNSYIWMRTGPFVDEVYASMVDTFQLYYGADSGYVDGSFMSWSTNGAYPPSKFAHLVWSSSDAYDKEALATAVQISRDSKVGYFSAMSSPWASEPWVPGWRDLVGMMRSCTTGSTSGAADLTGIGEATGDMTGDGEPVVTTGSAPEPATTGQSSLAASSTTGEPSLTSDRATTDAVVHDLTGTGVPLTSDTVSTGAPALAGGVTFVLRYEGDVNTFSPSNFSSTLARVLDTSDDRVLVNNYWNGSIVVNCTLLPSSDPNAPSPDALANLLAAKVQDGSLGDALGGAVLDFQVVAASTSTSSSSTSGASSNNDEDDDDDDDLSGSRLAGLIAGVVIGGVIVIVVATVLSVIYVLGPRRAKQQQRDEELSPPTNFEMTVRSPNAAPVAVPAAASLEAEQNDVSASSSSSDSESNNSEEALRRV